jgi:hypothetical protein
MNIYAPFWNNTSNTDDDYRNQTVQKRLASFRSTWRSTGVLNKRKGESYAHNRASFRSGEIRILDSTAKLEKTISFDEVQRKL